MALQSNGTISLLDLAVEFRNEDPAATNIAPIKFSDYYKGGELVPDIPENNTVGYRGGAIKLSTFYDTTSITDSITQVNIGYRTETAGFDTALEAYNNINITKARFWYNHDTSTVPNINDYLHLNQYGTDPVNGNNKWFSYGIDYVIQVDTEGRMTTVYNMTQTLSVDPSSTTIYKSAGSFTFSVSSNSDWYITDSQSWTTIDQSTATGTGNDSSVTVNFTENTTSSDRTGTIYIRTLDNYITKTISVTQKAVLAPSLDLVVLAHSTTSSGEACSKYDSGNNSTYYRDGMSFDFSTELYTDSNASNLAPQGWYSDGNNWKYWSGTSYTTDGSCGTGGGGIT